MNRNRIAYKIALRVKNAYNATGAFEKTVGKIISRSLGFTDAPKEFFEEVEAQFEINLEEAGMEMDLSDPEVYPELHRAINEVYSRFNA